MAVAHHRVQVEIINPAGRTPGFSGFISRVLYTRDKQPRGLPGLRRERISLGGT